MAIGAGLGSQLGYAVESTWGTGVTPDHFVRAKSYAIERVANRVQGEGIQTGVFGPLGAQYVEATNAATATLSLDVQTAKMGPLLQTLMGTSVTPSLVTTGVYSQTHTLADTYAKGLTVQVGAPYRSGTVIAHTLTGGKVTAATFSAAVGATLTGEFTIDGKAFTTTTSLATASYVASTPFHGGQMTLKMGTYNSETAISGVRSVQVSIERPHDTEDYTAGASGAKSQPVLNGMANIGVQIEADWLDKTVFQDLAHGTTPTSLVWTFAGPTISGANVNTFTITLPSVYFEPSTQGVGGPQELTNTWNAVWKYDGTNLPVITVISSESAL